MQLYTRHSALSQAWACSRLRLPYSAANEMSLDRCTDYSLRIAFLWTLKQAHSDSREEPDRQASSAPQDERPTPSVDLSPLFGREAQRMPKYPEKLIKTLEGILPRIGMGQESKFQNQRFRRIVAAFWSSSWADKSFQRQCKESRKVEDLIVHFVTVATRTLKKDDTLDGSTWISELHVQINIFLDLLVGTLSSLYPQPTTLISRVNAYRGTLSGSYLPTGTNGEAASSSVARDVSQRTEPADKNRYSSELIDVVGHLFKLDDQTLERMLRAVRRDCSLPALLDDFKQYLTMLNTGIAMPYGTQDFTSESYWNEYKAHENSVVQDLMLGVLRDHPHLTVPQERSAHNDLPNRFDALTVGESTRSLTYIPSDATLLYVRLLHCCLDHDLEALQYLPEDQEVSLGILSTGHQNLLLECASIWRLSDGFRAWKFLEACIERFEEGLVPGECVQEASEMVQQVMVEHPVAAWPIAEQDGLRITLQRRDTYLMASVENALQGDSASLYNPDFQLAVAECCIIDFGQTLTPRMEQSRSNIVDHIHRITTLSYRRANLQNTDTEGSDVNMVTSTGIWLEKEIKKLRRTFRGPTIPASRGLDLEGVVTDVLCRLWKVDVQAAMQAYSGSETIQIILDLYWRVKTVADISARSSSILRPVEVTALFFPAIVHWLDTTEVQTRAWAGEALAVDTFEPITSQGPSASVADLFDSFRSAADIVLQLDWPDSQQVAYFILRLSKMFSACVEDYCSRIEVVFSKDLVEMDAQPISGTTERQRIWLEKAKSTLLTLQGEKRLQSVFNFSPASCVKINNIEAAATHLDDLYAYLRVDEHVQHSDSPVTQMERSYLFSVKIVLAEGLSLSNSTKPPDSFVIVSDEKGKRFAKTRTVLEEADPRWEESFDIGVPSATWFMASIKHRRIAASHDILGRAYFCLDPSRYASSTSTDVLLPLDSGGHLLLRVSMESQSDDAQHHFGKAFRALRRTEADMIRSFVDKMIPVLRHTLSLGTIRRLLRTSAGHLTSSNYQETLGRLTAMYKAVDYNKALGNVTSVYKTAVGSPEWTIPPANDPSSEPLPLQSRPTSVESSRRKTMTDSEIEAAIHPLFDYLEVNMFTLASSLSAAAMQSVLMKLWKEILNSIEALIVPPLSDRPSKMQPLAGIELEVALKWLTFLRNFLHLNGDVGGLPETSLNNHRYNELLRIGLYYDWTTDDLMEECVKGLQTTLKYRASKPKKTLLSQRNLGTIRARKSAKMTKVTTDGKGSSEMIMRVLRMRSGTQDFLTQVLQTMSAVKMERPLPARQLPAAEPPKTGLR